MLLVLLVGLHLLDLQAWGQRLLQLLGLLLVGDDQCVQEARASDLELGVVGVLLDLDGVGVLPAGGHQELLDLLDFTGHCWKGRGQWISSNAANNRIRGYSLGKVRLLRDQKTWNQTTAKKQQRISRWHKTFTGCGCGALARIDWR